MDQSNDLLRQYMVEFEVPFLTDEMLNLIPAQQEYIDELFVNGKLMSYTVAEDRNKVWAVFIAESESELIDCVDSLPMTGYMEYDYHELMFYNTVHLLPAMSLN